MIWNGKRYGKLQTYKKRGEDDYILVDEANWWYEGCYAIVSAVCEIQSPEQRRGCQEIHLTLSGIRSVMLNRDYYPISQRKMRQRKGGQKWIDAFHTWFEEGIS